MNTRVIGTFAEDVIHLSRLGFVVNLGSSSLAELKAAINADKPVIAFLHTDALSYWTVGSAHALVVIGYDDASLYVNDPYFDDAPIKVPLDEFMAAWTQTDYLLAVVNDDDTET